MAKTRAQLNRAIRQEALRDQLASKGLVQKVLDNIDKMEKLAGNDHFELTKLKTANEQRMKLIDKYLPSLKATELTGDGGDSMRITAIELTSD